MSGHGGYRRIYRDSAGKLYAGDEAVFGGSQPHNQENNMGYEDFGLDLVDDDLGAMEYASLGYDYDDFGAMEYPSLGQKQARRYIPRGRAHRQRPRSARPEQVVQKTILNGTTGAIGAAGFVVGATASPVITIRPQFDFVAEDLTFTQVDTSTASAWTVSSIEFGDRIIFNNPVPTPIAVFATASFVRGLVKGAAIAAGLDIQLQCNVTAGAILGAGTTTTLTATFTGLKRGTTGCGPGAV